FAGCAYDQQAYKDQLKKDFDSLRLENTELTRQLEDSQQQNEELTQQNKTLTGLDPHFRFEYFYSLQDVKIHKYTNLYDKDKNGNFEKLIVYIQPMDSRGDIVKAAGSVDVQLWDLKNEETDAKIGQWQIQPDQLQQFWFAAIVTNYKLTLNLDKPIEKYDQPLVVKITFTDHLTGKTFQEQKIIESR
ncbi:MAG: hypothetical protein ACYSRQ_02215, partial [Planctomycetota bacterium]